MLAHHAVAQTSAALSEIIPIDAPDINKILTWWVHKVGTDDQEDVLNDIVVRILRYKPTSSGLVNAIANGTVVDHVRSQRYRGHLSLSANSEDREHLAALAVSLSGGTIDLGVLGDGILDISAAFTNDFEIQLVAVMDSLNLLDEMPFEVKTIVLRRLAGYTTSPSERQRLRRWRLQVLASYAIK